MKRFWLVLAAGLMMMQGVAVLAVEVTTTVVPDKAFYRPGEAVTLAVRVSGANAARVEAVITHLSGTVAEVFAPLQNGEASMVWTPPETAPIGYGVDVRALDANGQVVAQASSAFDVLGRWIDAPRYGFLSNFSAGRDNVDETMRLNAQYHVNGLQFYDWQYRHETLMPPDGMEPYSDVLGRMQSLATVKALIAGAHARNIAAMPYTAIYGASYAFYEQHKDWALFALKDVPYDFAGFLKIMDPTPGSPWATHLLGEFGQVLDKTDFDGIHIDQYGAPMHGRNAAGEAVNLEDVFPAFIDAAAAVVHEKRGEDGVTIFNNVRNWPTATTAPSDQNAVYIEVWEPYRYFMDLARIVSGAQKLGGGKPVIIAAYIPPERIENVRISNALILASGAYHLELGEPRGMLQHAYFPNYGTMSAEVQDLERRDYDFLVRYENVLALGTNDASEARSDALRIDGVKTDGRGSQDRVAVIVRSAKDATFETFSLVNLMGIDAGYWDAPVTRGATPLRDLAVTVQVDRAVARVWLASPDGTDPSAQAVEFTSADGSIAFSVPALDSWTMIVVEYAE